MVVVLAAAAVAVAVIVLMTIDGRPLAATALPPATDPLASTAALAPTDAGGSTTVVNAFAVPFDIDLPVGVGLHQHGPSETFVGWVDGPTPAAIYGSQTLESGNRRGLLVLSVADRSAHPCTVTMESQYQPSAGYADFLADLRSSGVELGDARATTVGGSPALEADISPTGKCLEADLHATGSSRRQVKLTVPSRLWSVDVRGQAVLVIAWAKDSRELEAWLPAATSAVDSIHFRPTDVAADGFIIPVTATGPGPIDASLDRVDAFVIPFSVMVPVDSGLKPATGEPVPEMVAWTDGPDDLPRPDGSGATVAYRYGGQNEDSGNWRGMIVASSGNAWVHRCRGGMGRVAVRSAPADFLADLRDVAGVAIGEIRETELAGYPALAADIVPRLNRCSTADLHVTGRIEGGLTREYVLFNAPARIVAAEVDGQPVFVLVWARTSDGFDDWLPEAQTIVDSIRFDVP